MTVNKDLMFEILKVIQTDVASMKGDLGDIKNLQLRMREDINRFGADLLRFERIEAETQIRLDRIEVQLGLLSH